MSTPAPTDHAPYPARLQVDHPERLDRLTSFFRLLWIIPIAIVLSALSGAATSTVKVVNETGEVLSRSTDTAGGIVGGCSSRRC